MRFLFVIAVFVAIGSIAKAQSVGISDVSATPDASAVLDVNSTTKGILIPRMRAAQRTSITSPANGLMVYQITDQPTGIWMYNGTNWAPGSLANVNLQTGTAYTIALSDNNGVIKCTNAGAITITVPPTLPAGFSCVIIQEDIGQITFSGGVNLVNSISATKTRAQNSCAGIITTAVGKNVLMGDVIP